MNKRLFFYLITLLTLSFIFSASWTFDKKNNEGNILEVSAKAFKKRVRSNQKYMRSYDREKYNLSYYKYCLLYFKNYFKNRKENKDANKYFRSELEEILQLTGLDTAVLSNNDTFCLIKSTSHSMNSGWKYFEVIWNDTAFFLQRDTLDSKVYFDSIDYNDLIIKNLNYFKRGMVDSIPRIHWYGWTNGMRITKDKRKFKAFYHGW
jgi:hypothetical protein